MFRGQSFLTAVEAVTPGNIWAVGIERGSFGSEQALIVNWDGTRWQRVSYPSLGSSSTLVDVVGLSKDDIWAVGSRGEDTLILHWNGRLWSIMASPNGSNSKGNQLRGIAAASPTDIWAVGMSLGSPLTLHWDGIRWSAVNTPKPGAIGNGLNSVAIVSSKDVWAVGWTGLGSFQALIMRWDGTRWSLVPGPDTSLRTSDANETSELTSIAIVNADEIWAVGYTKFYTQSESLIVRWNGIEWTKVESPKPQLQSSGLRDISVITKDDIWAVGYSGVDYAAAQGAVVEHWDGTNWSIIPNGGLFREQGFYGSAIDGSGDLWAVGEADKQPLISLFKRTACESSPHTNQTD